MINVIRTGPSRIKYCGRTVDNLIASNDGEAHRIIVVSSNKTPNENGLDALRAGIEASGGKPFVFLEDDLAFIRHFNRAADTFARTCGGVRSLILPLCANYWRHLEPLRGMAWRYPLNLFYGTQAFVITPADAQLFLDWIETVRPLEPAGFDILIAKWAAHHKKTHFLTPHRSFVQHLGVESSLHNGRFHHYSTWPGDQWEYRTGAFALDEQRDRPCDKALARAIAAWFGPKTLAYDLGCSTGSYVQELQNAGVKCWGFDATPGIPNLGGLISELDLARPQNFTETPGNVMCLEVAEHIHPEDEPHFIGNLQKLCSDKLAISWALPGQGGRRHVNEQEGHHVTAWMNQKGFIRDHAMTKKLREAATISWFKTSLYAFTRQNS